MNHIQFGEIGQLRNLCKLIKHNSELIGRTESGDPIYDETRKKPILEFGGTVKLHGTNASVVYQSGEIWFQSRECVLDSKNTLYGFYNFATKNLDNFKQIFDKFLVKSDKHCVIFGEWCGQGIQSGVAISQLPKSFFIFGVVVTHEDGSEEWPDFSGLSDPDNRIFNILDYSQYNTTIDFNFPEENLDYITQLTQDVENQCPVAKAFGVEGTGEGIVFVGYHDHVRYMFKSKGEKHKISEAKKSISIEPEKLESIEAFITYACTDNRFNQAVGIIGPAEPQNIGKLIGWMLADIIKEESDVLATNGLITKDIQPQLSANIRKRCL